GDGSTSRGDFHEAINIAAVQDLPCIFVVENNQFAYSTPLRLQSRTDFATKAVAYGIPGEKVDGTDVTAVYEATERAVPRARAGEGPSLIECVTMRMHGHAEHDPADYVPRELFDEWSVKHPLDSWAAHVLEGRALIGSVTMRLHGHAEHDPADYVPRELFDEWSVKDPLDIAARQLLEA